MNLWTRWRRKRDHRRAYDEQEYRRLTGYLAKLHPHKDETKPPRVFPTRPRRT